MEFKRNSVIGLHLAGKTQVAIVRALKHLDVNKFFVHRTIKRYNETGSIAKRYGGGRKKTATAPEVVQKVKKRLERNPRRSANQMAKDLNISQRSMRRILQNELKVKPYKLHEVPTVQQKQVDVGRAKQSNRTTKGGRTK